VKIYVLFCAFVLALQASFAAEPVGEFIELHSCDLYTGGCTASSESTLLGRQMFRVWWIKEGTWNNQNLAGLNVALLELGSVNLAEKGALGDRAELFVPKGLAPVQKDALLSWVNSQTITPASTQVRDAEITYQRSGPAANITVGDSVALSTMPIARCGSGACGQALWYEPQVKYSSYQVLASRVSKVEDAALNFLWIDHNRPNVFLASFGPQGTVSPADSVCR